ncbi:MAG: CDP-2,3-bis-(O-geranylgeranyl)-sn-glycerol synthase [Methanobrevibacter sp.]|uniref:CDP-2,3-bis-(O-geranylgeranyl)-sn-glycerol synthase n=1 Tax=Methanobrevibacter sp. TaxID=66852 RepID=UPI001DB8914F|nr:CDP-2,3-bis-(O-geranylgeranyl)-sn-glycerol synthase [Methanobrevibacter sp.]MBE6490611.1 CDP-2,3-bis-(O-geranylgeranyl)-sn-glycerol synthase [Methanobrevibacter sp.]MEE0934408.1 CDP-2,3-bis-(O-geranylgeranyl)-sn-glycerol synthase [Methanobrevibacter sp.]
MDIQMILIACVTTLYFILPAYFSNGGGLVFGGGIPVDFGKSDSKGNRWIGDGVTWRGMIGGTIIGIITGAVQGYFGPQIIAEFGDYIITPIITSIPEGILIGFLLGFGALLGDAIGSFLKRRLGIGRGKPAPILDQLDFLIVALILVSFVVKLNWLFVVIAIVMTLVIHLIANTGAYLLGMKDVWY